MYKLRVITYAIDARYEVPVYVGLQPICILYLSGPV